MDHEATDPTLSGATYTFYTSDDGYGGLPYAPTAHLAYHHHHHLQGTQPHDLIQIRPMSMLQHNQTFQFPNSPTRLAAGLQLPPSPSPANSITNTSIYDHPISPPVSGSDVSTDSQTPYHTTHSIHTTHAHGHGHTPHAHSYSRESSSGAGSPPARRTHAHRYHPATATVGGGRRPRRRSSTNDEQDLSDEGEQDHDPISPQSTGGGGGGGSLSGQALAESLANSRKEATRKQRIEAEQRRRDELREGYARLKNVLPPSNQKSSKVSLLERATNYIASIDQSNKILNARMAALEAEVARLREINERLSMMVASHTGQMPTELDLGLSPTQGFDHNGGGMHHHMDDGGIRPLSPPPDLQVPTTPSAQSQAQAQDQTVPVIQQPMPPAPPPHVGMYHHANDSTASASGSEY